MRDQNKLINHINVHFPGITKNSWIYLNYANFILQNEIYKNKMNKNWGTQNTHKIKKSVTTHGFLLPNFFTYLKLV